MFLLCMYEISKVFNNLQNNIQYIYIYNMYTQTKRSTLFQYKL